MTGVLGMVVQLALLAGAAPLLAGLPAWAAARRAGVPGPAAAQPWRDLVRLWRKEAVVPDGASWLFAAVPAVSLAAATAAALLVPGFGLGLAAGPAADLVVVAALLAVSRGLPWLAAFDGGAAAAVHAEGRALLARVGAVPVLFLVALAGAVLSGGTNLDAVATAVRDGGAAARVAGALCGAALFCLLAGAGGTEPGGTGPGGTGPGGAWSGRPRALAVLAGQVRVVAGLELVVVLGCPWGLASGAEGWVVGVLAWAVKLLVLGMGLSLVGTPRLVLPVGAVLAALAVVVAGLQGGA